MHLLHHLSRTIGIVGALVIALGVAIGLVRFLRLEFAAAQGSTVENERRQLRIALGYYLLLGLEFLIAADIIDTLLQPAVTELVVLGSIVLIRTVISYSLNAELAHARTHAVPQS